MRKTFRTAWIFCLVSLVTLPAVSVTFRVSPVGNDAWSGQLAEPTADKTDGPLASLAGARDAVRKLKATGPLSEPVEILIADGTYELPETLTFAPEDSGTEQYRIVYAAAPGAKPVISGGRAITGWKKGEGALYETHIAEAKDGAWKFHELFVNDQRATRARTPNKDYFHIAGPIEPIADREKAQKDPATKIGFRYNEGEIKPWAGWEDVNIWLYHSWTSSLHWIKEIDESNRIVRFAGPSGWPVGYWDAHSRYFVENYREALDAPGEWYLHPKSGVLYYWPREGEDMASAHVAAPKLSVLLRVEGDLDQNRLVEYIGFKGLSFQHADWFMDPAATNDGQAAAFQKDAALVVRAARGIAFDQCEIAHVGTYALWFRAGAKNGRVTQCHLHDLGTGGLRIGECETPPNDLSVTESTFVENCWIHDGGHVFPAGHGVWIGKANGNTVRRCDVGDLYYSAFAIGWSWGYAPSTAHDNVVELCHIHDIGKGVLSDMGGIYTLGISPGTRLANNVIHDIYSYDYGGWGLYNDEGSTGIVLENNIVYNTKSGGYHQHYGKENIIRNNVFAFAKQEQLIRTREEEHTSFFFERNVVVVDNGKVLGSNWNNDHFTVDNNLYWDCAGNELRFGKLSFAEWQAKGHDVHSIVADPLFENIKAYDFRLKHDSPAYTLGFKDIDTSQVGLFGALEWVNAPKQIKRAPIQQR